MNEQNSQDLQALQARLEAVRSDLDQALDAAVRRGNTMKIVLIVLVVFVAGYLFISYGMLKKELTVDALVGIADQQLDALIAGNEEEVSQMLVDAAPGVIDQAAGYIREVPALAADHIRQLVTEQAHAKLPEIEHEITDGLLATIDQAKAEAEQSTGGKLDEAAFNDLTRRVAEEYGNHVRGMVAQARGIFSQQIDNLTAKGEERLTKLMVDAAPGIIDQIAARIAEAPALLTSEIRMQVRAEIDRSLPELEVQVIDSLKETVNRVHAKAEEHADGPLDEAAFNKITSDIADEYGKQIRQMIKDAQGRYEEHANQLFTYLDELATGDQATLSERERHHLALITSVLAVLEKYASENPDFLFLVPDDAG